MVKLEPIEFENYTSFALSTVYTGAPTRKRNRLSLWLQCDNVEIFTS